MRSHQVVKYIFLFIFLSLPLASAILIDNPNLPLVKNVPTVISFNNNTAFVNLSADSILLQGLTPQQVANLFVELDPKAYNGTLAYSSSLANYYPINNPYTFWNSTFATFNKTYADTLYYNKSTTYNRTEVDELVGGVNIDLIFHNSSSGISTYWDMNKTDSRPKNSSVITITTDEQYLGGFISKNASDMGITTIASGLAVGHFHAKVNTITGVKLMSGFFRFYIRYANTTEVLISTSELIPVRSLVENTFEAHAIISSDISLNESDRILVKMYSNFSGGGGGNPILTTYFGGETASRIEIGTTGVNFATQIDLLDYFKHDGSTTMTGNANWGGFNISNLNWASGDVGNFTSLIVGNANISGVLQDLSSNQYAKYQFGANNFNGSGNFTTTGRVGIGTDSPDFKLQVDGDIAPETTSSSSFGSIALRWLKGWFVNIDASGNINAVNYSVGGVAGFTGDCTNVSYSGGLAVSCND